MSTLQVDASALNELFNKTTEKHVGKNATTDAAPQLRWIPTSSN